MIRVARLKPLLSSTFKTLIQTPTTTSFTPSTPVRPPTPPPYHFFQICPVSGTPKGKARLKTLQSLKKKSFTQKKKGKEVASGDRRHGGPPVTKTRPVILRLNARLRRREVEREKLGLVSKLRKRDLEIKNARAEKAKEADGEAGTTLMGLEGMSLVQLGFVDGAVPMYRLMVEDGRKLAAEYSMLLMRWEREQKMAENGLLELRKAAIEALPVNLRRAALMPMRKKKKEGEGDEGKKKVVVGKGKQKSRAGKKPALMGGKKGGGKATNKG